MISFSADILVITLAIVFLAALNHGAIGLGFPLLATPLLSLMFDVRVAVMLTLFLGCYFWLSEKTKSQCW